MSKTLLDAVREYGIYEVKTILDASQGDISYMTLKNYWLKKPTLFRMICVAVKQQQNKAP